MRIPAPRVVDLLLTYDCNCRCAYCFVKDRGARVTMTAATLDRAIDFLFTESRDELELVFLGGEPTLELGLIERAVLRARRWARTSGKRVSFSMTTNLVRMTIPTAMTLASWGVRYLVSVDGVGERHDRARPCIEVPSAFAVIARMIPRLRALQDPMGARVTPTPASVRWLAADLARLAEIGFNYFIVSPATGVPWTDHDLDEFVTQLSSYAAARPRDPHGLPTPVLGDYDEGVPAKGWGCGAGRGRYAVDPQGRLFACARFAQLDADHGLALGDIYSGIDPAGPIARFQDESTASRPRCAACDLRAECLGGCPAVNLDATSSLVDPAPDECRFNRAMSAVRHALTSGSPVSSRPFVC